MDPEADTPPTFFTAEDIRLAGVLADHSGWAYPGLFLQFLPHAIRERERGSKLYHAFRAQQSLPHVLEETARFCGEVMQELAAQDIRCRTVQYDEATVTCRQKERLWKGMGLEETLREEIPAVRIDMIKSVLFQYISQGTEKYILACTLPQSQVSMAELRAELGLSPDEAKSLTVKRLDTVDLFNVTGKETGALSPLMAPSKVQELAAVYFTEDLRYDAQEHPEKFYDVALTPQESIFVNAEKLFGLLRQRSDRYQSSAVFDDTVPFEVTQWKVKPVDMARAGVNYLFTETRVRYKGQEYVIKNPPLEGKVVAMPFPREYEWMKTHRVELPLTYGMVERRYEIEKGEGGAV